MVSYHLVISSSYWLPYLHLSSLYSSAYLQHARNARARVGGRRQQTINVTRGIMVSIWQALWTDGINSAVAWHLFCFIVRAGFRHMLWTLIDVAYFSVNLHSCIHFPPENDRCEMKGERWNDIHYSLTRVQCKITYFDFTLTQAVLYYILHHLWWSQLLCFLIATLEV